MRHLLLTLGHNSSAILVEDGKVLCGYETERLTKIKSDSAFPQLAIEEIEKYFEIPEDVIIYVSHWFIDTDDIKKTSKWWVPEYLAHKYPNSQVVSLSKDFTHHDAHAFSAVAFCKDEWIDSDTTIIVADGFGNYGEVISIYYLEDFDPNIAHRSYGFNNSLGLMYQYATSYLDLKMNQDEYKLLGYEANITDIDIDLEVLSREIDDNAFNMAPRVLDKLYSKYDPVTTIDALPAVTKYWYGVFDDIVKRYDISDSDKRVVIAYYVQRTIEKVLEHIVHRFNIHNLIVVGGIFMNVKLNSHISRCITGLLSIMPLSGDNGAAIGVYEGYNGDFEWPNHLFWGQRDLSKLENNPECNFFVKSRSDAVCFIQKMLNHDYIVNIVSDKMEFGARALGNTSTIAAPTTRNVQYINMCNKRSTIMPMAGFCTMSTALDIHVDVHHIIKSMEYMVCTRDYRQEYVKELRGAAHHDPIRDEYTGRTQIVYPGDILYDILSEFRLLINTSFNPHGKPIVFSAEDIVDAHNFMRLRDTDNRIVTVIIKE